MKRNILAAVAAAFVVVCSAAEADMYSSPTEGYADIILSGSPYEFGQVQWDGILTVTTDSSSDGVYSADSLLDLTFTSSLVDFSFTGDGQPSVSVTIEQGAIADVYSAALYQMTDFQFTGQSLVYTNIGKAPQQGITSLVPEPKSGAMLIMGAIVIGLVRRQRQSWQVKPSS